ncbi:MAG TPA: sigma-70 family RNA polymerase sigma factor [Longimicrobium sp.]|nr:sigma-70 family RNA polymerase sigma factor [Longimicrobium sp.]
MDRQEAEQLFIDHLAMIERLTAKLCRSRDLIGADAEDVDGWIKMKLVEDDYAAVRKFRGESGLGTYLTVVVSMLFRDRMVKDRGRWRPSAAARRLGPLAIRLETLVYKHRTPFSQAAEIVRSEGLTDQSDHELARLLSKLKPRSQLRPQLVNPEDSDQVEAPFGADKTVIDEENDRARRETYKILLAALAALPPEDQAIVRLWIWEEKSVAEIARALSLEQKPLYRRIERLMKQLRRELEACGITQEQALSDLDEEAQ